MIAALPLAAVLTLAATPFWRWIESRYGIESIGHSGPSDWCFLAVYLLILLGGSGVLVRRWREPR